MGEAPEVQNNIPSKNNEHAEQVEHLQEERIERRLSFYNKLANLKYGCILQIFSVGVIISYLVLDTVFKVVQTHTNDLLAMMLEKFSDNKLEE